MHNQRIMKNYTDILELHPEASMLTERYFEDPDHAVSEEQELFLEELLFLFTSQKDTDGAELRKKFEGYSVATLVDYLRRTHRLYQSKLIPEIEQRIFQLSRTPGLETNGRSLLLWFGFFKGELMEHMLLEEMNLFPYALEKAAGNDPQGYSIDEFLDHHDPSEDHLTALLNSDLLDEDSSLCRVIKGRMRMFQHDLKVHVLIEEEVLPYKLNKH